MRQHRWVNNFWDCSIEQFEALGQSCARDPKFSSVYASFHPELPEFIFRAIQHDARHNPGVRDSVD